MKTVIGISGKAQHGKDTVAKFLQEKYGGEIEQLKNKIKSMDIL